jgi:hypothetical protein
VVLGRAGTGKTLLLRSLGQILHADGKRAAGFGAGTVDADVVLMDDAGSLDAAGLERLCALPQSFVAAGLPEIEPRFLKCHRSIEVARLLPLAPEDVARYLVGRLAATSRPRDLFEPDAILALAGHSGGLLRLVIVLAGSAMFLAEQEDAPHVTRWHVDEAAAMREVLLQDEDTEPAQVVPVDHGDEGVPTPDSALLPPAPRPLRIAPFAGALAGLIGLGLAAAWEVSHWHHVPSERLAERARPEANAPPLAPPALPPAAPQLAPAAVPSPAPLPPPRPAVVPIRPQGAPPLPPEPAGTTVVAFRGPITNETMGQSGQLSLTIRSGAAPGPVDAHFHAYAGLIGSGELTGSVGPDGRLNLSGQLMMGPNPYNCSLSGTLNGGTLTGSATFVRAGGRGSARSTFTLSRL